MSHLVEQLPPNQQAVLILLYGLKDGEARSLAQVALALGISREQVRWAHTKALQALRAASPPSILSNFVKNFPDQPPIANCLPIVLIDSQKKTSISQHRIIDL